MDNSTLLVFSIISQWILFFVAGLIAFIRYLIKRRDRARDIKEENESEAIVGVKETLVELKGGQKVINGKLESLIVKVDIINSIIDKHDIELRDINRDIKVIGYAYKDHHGKELPLSK